MARFAQGDACCETCDPTAGDECTHCAALKHVSAVKAKYQTAGRVLPLIELRVTAPTERPLSGAPWWRTWGQYVQLLGNLYSWLRFLHLLGLAGFLLSHGVTIGASLAMRGPVSPSSRGLLRLSLRSGSVAFPALALMIVTGVWMAFAAHLWGKFWIWASIVVLVAVVMAMGFIANGYRAARGAGTESDSVLDEKLRQTRPIAAVWIGGVGLLVLLYLMVFKPF